MKARRAPREYLSTRRPTRNCACRTNEGGRAQDEECYVMSDLVVIEFPSEAKAEEVRQKLLSMQREYLIELGDAVIAVKEPNGHVKLNQLVNTTAVGAVGGAMWGTLVGLIFLMPKIGR